MQPGTREQICSRACYPVPGLDGYINDKVLFEGLTRTGQDLNRERFLEAIESIHYFPLLPCTTLCFGPNDYKGLDQVYFTRLMNGSFILLKDCAAIMNQAKTVFRELA